MKKCPNCDVEIDDISKPCKNCGAQIITAGRDEKNSILIPKEFTRISNFHLIIAVINDEYYIRDISTNGTLLNGKNVENRIDKDKKVEIKLTDILYIPAQNPEYELSIKEAIDLTNKKVTPIDDIPVSGTRDINLDGKKKEINVGREEKGNDLVLNSPYISSEHAKITIDGDEITVKDLNSTNGTYVNGKKIPSGVTTKINPDDELRIYDHIIRFKKKVYKGAMKIDVVNVARQELQEGVSKDIISDISFTVYPSELVGIMGPAGSGKTTLLRLLGGYKSPDRGEVLINGDNLHKNYDLFRGDIGYVPQESVLHEDLTVYESLYYATKLKLGRKAKKEDIKKRIDQVLDEVGLKELTLRARKVSVISGGEKKRLNIAHELILRPKLLLLDEPTSGLSAMDARTIMGLIKSFKDSGMIIILTIHQPSADMFKMLDNVVILNHGKMLYYGKTYPDAISYFDKNAGMINKESSYYCDVTEKLEDKTPEDYQSSKEHNTYVTKRLKNLSDEVIIEKQPHEKSSGPNFHQWWILSRRYMKVKMRDKQSLFVLLLQSPIISILIALTLRGNYDNNGGVTPVLYFITLSAIWLGCINSIRDIVIEKPIYNRERMVNLGILPYVFSKIVDLQLIAMVQCLILSIVVYYVVGMRGNIFIIYGFLLLTMFISISLGLFISSSVKSVETAISSIPLILLPIALLGSPFVLYRDAHIAIKYVSYATITRWCFGAILKLEAEFNSIANNEALRLGLLNENTLLLSLIILVSFWLLLTLSTILSLKIRNIK